jgi:hypothetical protein
MCPERIRPLKATRRGAAFAAGRAVYSAFLVFRVINQSAAASDVVRKTAAPRHPEKDTTQRAFGVTSRHRRPFVRFL